jgi:hypothetical protein
MFLRTSWPLVVLLEGANSYLPLDEGINPLHRCRRPGDGGDDGDVVLEGRGPDGNLIGLGPLSTRRVDDQLDLSVFYQVHHRRTPLPNFKYLPCRYAVAFQDLTGPVRRYDLETEIHQPPGDHDDAPLVPDQQRSGIWHRPARSRDRFP